MDNKILILIVSVFCRIDKADSFRFFAPKNFTILDYANETFDDSAKRRPSRAPTPRTVYIVGEIPDVPVFKEATIEQPLDHFDKSDEANRWQQQTKESFIPQRYYVTKSFYKDNGIAFLLIGGESPLDSLRQTELEARLVPPFRIQLAEKFGAMYFELEHRYYGRSRPTEDLSTDNLAYLTTAQALADTAAFIQAMSEQHGLNRWIVFGGSYSGTLAVWLKQKYPDLVHGIVASSAPLEAKFESNDYFETSGAIIRQYSQKCYTAIENLASQLKTALHSSDGRQQMQRIMNLCEELDPNDVQNTAMFFLLIAMKYFATQYIDPNDWKPIAVTCRALSDAQLGANEFHRFARLLRLNEAKRFCYNPYIYERAINDASDTSYDSQEFSDLGTRQWLYFLCSEFGTFTVDTGSSDPFGDFIPVAFFVRSCKDAFGSTFTEDSIREAVQRTNEEHGGKNIKVSNTILVNGSLDPDYPLGITSSDDPAMDVIFIDGTSHAKDMHHPFPDDPPSLVKARQRIREIIDRWLQQPLASDESSNEKTKMFRHTH